MPTILITYAWDDNTDGDVDFIAQELARAGPRARLDQWNIRAGGGLWGRIAGVIGDTTGPDGWLVIATAQSLGSKASKDEFAYAHGRAVAGRGSDFPVIALFPGPVDESLLPAGIRTSLNISLADPEWSERITAAVEGRSPSLVRPQIEPFTIHIYRHAAAAERRVIIEVRPRAGTWCPFFAAVPLPEKDRVQPRIICGPRGRVPQDDAAPDAGAAPSSDNAWWVLFAQSGATPTESYYIHCSERPSRLAFGVHGGRPQFVVGDLKPYPSRDL